METPGSVGNASGPEGPSDRSLLRRFRGGSQDAATQIYLRYAHRLRALAQANCSADLARCVDTDEIVQSVFGSFFRGASKGYYEVPDGEDLWRLFLVIALNKIRTKGAFHRAAKRDVRLTRGGDYLDRADALPAGTGEAEYAFLKVVIDDVLDRLPHEHKRMVVLRVEGHRVAEIAQETGRSKRTVERILQEARQTLGGLLHEGE